MRTNIVLVVACSACGETLQVADELGPKQQHGADTPQLPTGALNLRVGTIRVDPCKGCVEPAKRAARQISEGLATLSAQQEEPGSG